MSDTTEKPKGRGRPRKYPVGQSKSELLAAARAAGTIRKRGRPPKNAENGKRSPSSPSEEAPTIASNDEHASFTGQDNDVSLNEDETSNKRKRGRPPKSKQRSSAASLPILSPTAEDREDGSLEPSAKRRRGRPSKGSASNSNSDDNHNPQNYGGQATNNGGVGDGSIALEIHPSSSSFFNNN